MKKHTVTSRGGLTYKRTENALVVEGPSIKMKVAPSVQLPGGWDFAYTDGVMTHGITAKNKNRVTTAIGAFYVMRSFLRQKLGYAPGDYRFEQVEVDADGFPSAKQPTRH